MKQNTAKAFSLLAVLALATAAFAQQTSIKANVPFAFSVGKKSFPAGEYTIRQLTPDFLVLSNDQGSSTVMLPERLLPDLEASSSKLKFQRSNGHAALTEIWSGDEGYRLPVRAQDTTIESASQ